MPAEEETDGVVADQVEIDANEDVQQIKTAPSPKLPSPQEVEDHRNIHIPFRDWCRFCGWDEDEAYSTLVRWRPG